MASLRHDGRAARAAALTSFLFLLVLLFQACSDEGTDPPVEHALTVEVTGIGAGRVVSDPAGIDCGPENDGSCSASFEEGTVVRLSAEPAEGMAFVGWSGACSGVGACTVTMEGGAAVTGEFDNPDRVVQEVGPGGGEVVARDSSVTLTIPAGALSSATEISVEVMSPDELGEELDGVRSDVGIDAAWELGPAGTEFAEPVRVTVHSDQPSDTTAVDAELLFWASGDRIEALDSLQLNPGSDGRRTVTGELRHFSVLGLSKLQGHLRFEIEIPDELHVDEVVDLTPELYSSDLVSVEGGHYDPEGSALRPFQPTEEHGGVPLTPVSSNLHRGVIRYTCREAGESPYESSTVARASFPFLTNSDGDLYYFRFEREEVVCLPPLVDLTVVIEGTGEGTVHGSGFFCASDDDEPCVISVPENSDVVLHAQPLDGSSFAGWSGDGTDTGLRERTVTAVDGATVYAVFEKTEIGPIEPGLHDLPDLTNPDGIIHVCMPGEPGPCDFRGYEGDYLVWITGEEGVIGWDLEASASFYQATDHGDRGPWYGAESFRPVDAPEDEVTIVFYGEGGLGVDAGDGSTTFLDGLTLDATPVPGTDWITVVQAPQDGGLQLGEWTGGSTPFNFAGEPLPYFNGQPMISAVSSGEGGSGEDSPGSTIVITFDATNGGVGLVPGDGGELLWAFGVGAEAARIDCIMSEASGGGSGTGGPLPDDGDELVCAATVNGTDQLYTMTWDGVNLPEYVTNVTVDEGPIGLSMLLLPADGVLELPEDRILALTTSIENNTITQTWIGTDGTVLSTETLPVPAGCAAPANAVAAVDAEGLKLVGTCLESGNLFVMEGGLP